MIIIMNEKLEMKIIEHISMGVTDILKATLICRGNVWQECTKCPLYGKNNCEEILSQFQRIFIKEHINNKTHTDFYGEDILK